MIKKDTLEKALPLIIFLTTGIVFLPVINWLTGQTIAHEQLLHAFLVFLLSGTLLVFERKIEIRLACRFSDMSQNLLIFSYALLVLAIFTRINLVILASLCLSLAAFFIFLFGMEQKRFIFSSIGTFAFFTAIAVLLPVIDWPLRTLAGKWAAFGLGVVGNDVQLGLIRTGSEPMLILLSNGNPFHVAAECNGFGMLGSSLLMALVILLYRPIPLIERLGWLGVAALIGLCFNIVRIIVIVLLAPALPPNAYMLMHEVVGLLSTYGGLAALYFLLMPKEAEPSGRAA
ncbi:MAG: exosortase/archaeosortase family protein [Opitutales bacterium]|jgi:exosortase/archaeosortase family protein